MSEIIPVNPIHPVGEIQKELEKILNFIKLLLSRPWINAFPLIKNYASILNLENAVENDL